MNIRTLDNMAIAPSDSPKIRSSYQQPNPSSTSEDQIVPPKPPVFNPKPSPVYRQHAPITDDTPTPTLASIYGEDIDIRVLHSICASNWLNDIAINTLAMLLQDKTNRLDVIVYKSLLVSEICQGKVSSMIVRMNAVKLTRRHYYNNSEDVQTVSTMSFPLYGFNIFDKYWEPLAFRLFSTCKPRRVNPTGIHYCQGL